MAEHLVLRRDLRDDLPLAGPAPPRPEADAIKIAGPSLARCLALPWPAVQLLLAAVWLPQTRTSRAAPSVSLCHTGSVKRTGRRPRTPPSGGAWTRARGRPCRRDDPGHLRLPGPQAHLDRRRAVPVGRLLQHQLRVRERRLAVPADTAQYSSAANSTFTTAYNADGEPVTETEPGGAAISSSYNNMGDLTGQTGSGADAPTAARSFGYDEAGDIGVRAGRERHVRLRRPGPAAVRVRAVRLPRRSATTATAR